MRIQEILRCNNIFHTLLIRLWNIIMFCLYQNWIFIRYISAPSLFSIVLFFLNCSIDIVIALYIFYGWFLWNIIAIFKKKILLKPQEHSEHDKKQNSILCLIKDELIICTLILLNDARAVHLFWPLFFNYKNVLEYRINSLNGTNC